jgi:hypothetical protein
MMGHGAASQADARHSPVLRGKGNDGMMHGLGDILAWALEWNNAWQRPTLDGCTLP